MYPKQAHIPQIVIVGGGVAGLELATHLGKMYGRRNHARIKLVDYARTHIWKPLYHQVAAGLLDPCLDQIEYFSQAKRHHFQFHLGRLHSIQRKQQRIQLEATYDNQGNCIIPTQTLQYDILVLAVGSVANDFAIPGVKKYCHFLDTLQQATSFNERFINTYLQAQMQSTALRPGQLKIAIVGTGATGIELAAELHSAAQKLASYGLDRCAPYRNVHISLIGGTDSLLPSLPKRLANSICKQLELMDIRYYMNEWVTEVTATDVKTKSGRCFDSEFTVWAGGIKAPDVLDSLDGLETNKVHQLCVHSTLQTTVDPKIFALGDCAALPWKEGKLVPARAQAAHQQAQFMIDAIKNYLTGYPLPHFQYQDYGSLISLGKYSAVGNLMGAITGGNLLIEGHIARWAYSLLYRRHQIALNGLGHTALLTLSNMVRNQVKPQIKLH